MSEHGIAIREKKTKKLVHFYKCEVGEEALRILSGVRINMSDKYIAEESMVAEEEIEEIL